MNRCFSDGVRSLVLVLTIVCGLAVGWARTADAEVDVIPRPVSVEGGQGVFPLNNESVIRLGDQSVDLLAIGVFLRTELRKSHGLQPKLDEARPASSAKGEIRLNLVGEGNEPASEGYKLAVTPDDVVIESATPTGLFWGTQTLLQIAAIASAKTRVDADSRTLDLPVVRIVDRPRFPWRGFLLDCSRTFLPIAYLERFVDAMSFYKMNVLHLHLTDDQGWRVEIRSHPELTEIGSRFHPGFQGEIGGYYTPQQIKDLVRYAAARRVTIVPEIDMPGHTLALLASIPELSCRGGEDRYVIAPYLFMSDGDPTKEPKTPHGVLCPGNEKTFKVIEDILAEVIELFPSEYIHLGGDECPKTFWKQCPKCQARIKAEGLKDEEELQSYFVKRVAKMVQDRGRKVIGWDEVLEGGLAPGVMMMSWRGMEAGITAARMGHPVVMASKSHLYFDYCFNRTPTSLAYAFDPIPPELSAEQQKLVQGLQACMWTHLARTTTGIDMQIFPRILAVAEVGWTPRDRRGWDDFSRRLTLHESILELRGVPCFIRNDGPELPNLTAGQDGRLWLVNAAGKIHVRQGDAWEPFPGQARQVTSGPDGTVWALNTEPTKRGYALMRWSDRQWAPVGEDVAGVQISAGPDGSVWTATEAYAVWKYVKGQWSNVQGLASEVSVGPDNTAWVLTSDAVPGGFELYYAHNSRLRRALPPTAGMHIAAGPAGQVWMIRDDGALRQWNDGRWHDRPGTASQLAVTPDGTVWGLAPEAKSRAMQVVKWNGKNWQTVGNVP